MNFNEKLVSLRRSKGLSQEQLANQINVSRQAVSKWETAESQPDLAKLILLGDVFDITIDDLCGRKTEIPANEQTQMASPRTKAVWLPLLALILGLAIGLASGVLVDRRILPEPTPHVIDAITISSLTLYPELYDQKIRVVFSPSIANESFHFDVEKVDASGKTTTYPATYHQGTCISIIDVDNADLEFTLYAVIDDGAYEHTTGLIKIFDLDDVGYAFEELWNQ